MDSLMNVRLSLYCVRLEKRAGRLRAEEGADTAGMIDDAVQAISLHGGSSVDMAYAQRAATSHFETTDECWTNAGACLDRVKTN